jgi:hypothetical protein
MMLISSFVLSIVGTSIAIYAEINGLWTYEYMFADVWYARIVMIFFINCNILDLLLGYFYYREFLYPLTTIVHHIFFITVSILMVGWGYSRGFLFCFPLEIPTFLLALGTIWSFLRTDLAFGFLFFWCRIVYHAGLIYRIYSVEGFGGSAWKLCSPPLLLHLHWFSNWCQSAMKRHYYKTETEGKKK